MNSRQYEEYTNNLVRKNYHPDRLKNIVENFDALESREIVEYIVFNHEEYFEGIFVYEDGDDVDFMCLGGIGQINYIESIHDSIEEDGEDRKDIILGHLLNVISDKKYKKILKKSKTYCNFV